jgi:outer membrane protein TolC
VLQPHPDVRAAERDLAAAGARIGVAKARLYPSLTLTGTVGASATAISDLSELLADGAYRSSVLSALEDIESALVQLRTASDRAEALAGQAEASDRAARLERLRYRSGLIDMPRPNGAEQSPLSAQDASAEAHADQATAVIHPQLAVGGGWDPDSIENTME